MTVRSARIGLAAFVAATAALSVCIPAASAQPTAQWTYTCNAILPSLPSALAVDDCVGTVGAPSEGALFAGFRITSRYSGPSLVCMGGEADLPRHVQATLCWPDH